MAIAVLGAGILGSLTALELASRGQQVVLFERNEEALTEASLINEGKIHRGFVYAADFSFRTAKVMLDGAQNFETTLSKFVPAAALAALRTEPFEYVVHNESMLSVP
ncbi:MAG TPA: FAD-dependent oxidoreductase, partial [Aestuariivirgaceae bacterium]